MRMITNRRLLVVLVSAGCLTAGLGSGAAYAYFTSSGTGSATATVGTLKNVTLVTATATVTNKLIPGGTGDVTLNISNTNGFQVTLTKVDPNGTPTNSCGTTGVTFARQDSLSRPIAANTTTTVTLANAASMDATSATACQGATISIPVTITVQK